MDSISISDQSEALVKELVKMDSHSYTKDQTQPENHQDRVKAVAVARDLLKLHFGLANSYAYSQDWFMHGLVLQEIKRLIKHIEGGTNRQCPFDNK